MVRAGIKVKNSRDMHFDSGSVSADRMAYVVGSQDVSFNGFSADISAEVAVIAEDHSGDLSFTNSEVRRTRRESAFVEEEPNRKTRGYVSGWRPPTKRLAFPQLHNNLFNSTAVWLFWN
jgi:hypothetical protein